MHRFLCHLLCPGLCRLHLRNPETGAFYHYPARRIPKPSHSSEFPTTGDISTKAGFKQAVYDGTRPYIFDEFGGIKCLEATPTKDLEKGKAQTTSWGYGVSTLTKDEFYKRLEGQVNALLSISEQVWGYCYTQLTDVEQEENGLYFYNRTPKYDAARLKAIFGKEPTK